MKTGDTVIVSALATGVGEEILGTVTGLEECVGVTYATVTYNQPDVNGRTSGHYATRFIRTLKQHAERSEIMARIERLSERPEFGNDMKLLKVACQHYADDIELRILASQLDPDYRTVLIATKHRLEDIADKLSDIVLSM